MRTPIRTHHGQPMGSRRREERRDEILIGDHVTWTTDEGSWEGRVVGRECCAVAEVWWVRSDDWVGRIHRRQIVRHKPPGEPWTPAVVASIPPQDDAEERARALVLAHAELGWDGALRALGISRSEGVRRWGLAVTRGWVGGGEG